MMTSNIPHLYLHVPFCNAICAYCDFCHGVYRKEKAEKWLERVRKEIKENCGGLYETVYIGGGTPTSLSAEELEKLLSYLDPYTKEAEEYTVEANPESLNEEKILVMKAHGVDRISLGVQTSDEGLLRLLNRRHSFADVKEKIGLLRKHGISNISADLMYSLPGQTMEILEKTLDDILLLDLPHISIYSLTVEENTLFGKRGYTPLDEDTEADMYEMIVRKLTEAGYRHYEVSNFAKEGYGSRHNLGYWRYDDFLGISMGAASKISHVRYTNTRDLDRYLSSEDIREEVTKLSEKDVMFENVMMSLRTDEGLDRREFQRRYGRDFLEVYQKAVEERRGDLLIDEDRVRAKDIALLHPLLLSFMDDE